MKNKENKTKPVAENNEQNQAATKKQNTKKNKPAVDNNITDTTKNTASQELGLNQDKTKNNDLEPGIH